VTFKTFTQVAQAARGRRLAGADRRGADQGAADQATADQATADQATADQGGTGRDGIDVLARGQWRSALRWEIGLVVALVAVIVFANEQTPEFLHPTTFFYVGINMGYLAIMALPLTLIIVTGEIDLSVASMLSLSGAVMGELFAHHWPVWPAMIAALAVGLVGGALNGLLVARFGLPSIAVTIGTMTLFEGVAEIVLGTSTVTGFPNSLTQVGVAPIPGTQLSWSAGMFLVLAITFGLVLHATPTGRSIFAIGLQPEAAQFAGIRVRRIKFTLFAISGLVSAFAGILLTLQNASVSYDVGNSLALNVVVLVLFGGVSIFGGRGTVIGVVLSVAVIGCLQQAMTQMQVQPYAQYIVLGVLLLISIVLPGGGETVRRLRSGAARWRRVPAPQLSSSPKGPV
jgi:rhamnose transport system permease protein